MRRVGELWQSVIAMENLLLAFHKAILGKRRRPEAAAFAFRLEDELFGLRDELVAGRYQPGAYRVFAIYDRKPRMISAAPFRDRVVHHALMNVLEPILDRRFIFDSYACRKGKGVHAAVNRYQVWSAQYCYVLKLDIRRYFPSIRHDCLLSQLAARIKDQRVLALCAQIIATGDNGEARGLPIGNLTSQILANLYLDDTDHWLKETLHVPAYLRYVDDLILLDNDPARLWCWLAQLRERVSHLGLEIPASKVQLAPCRRKLSVLGYQCTPKQRWLRRDNVVFARRRLRRMAKRFALGALDLKSVRAALASWIGHAAHADSFGLRRRLMDQLRFQRRPT